MLASASSLNLIWHEEEEEEEEEVINHHQSKFFFLLVVQHRILIIILSYQFRSLTLTKLDVILLSSHMDWPLKRIIHCLWMFFFYVSGCNGMMIFCSSRQQSWKDEEFGSHHHPKAKRTAKLKEQKVKTVLSSKDCRKKLRQSLHLCPLFCH